MCGNRRQLEGLIEQICKRTFVDHAITVLFSAEDAAIENCVLHRPQAMLVGGHFVRGGAFAEVLLMDQVHQPRLSNVEVGRRDLGLLLYEAGHGLWGVYATHFGLLHRFISRLPGSGPERGV